MSTVRAIPTAALLAGLLLCGGTPRAADPPLAAVTIVGAVETVFTPKRDACDGDDVPDANARAFRDATGSVVVFAMHMKNRALRGPDLANLKIDCASPLPSQGDADPARYDDATWITATWTEDGRRIEALLHHEYRANTHPGRCTHKEYLACWYNTVVAARSMDGGRTFERASPPVVVAAPPFRQEVGQGRHRGFFNPSNIVAHGRHRYMMVSTTGWPGQASGPCLFRTADPADPTSWRAFDGKEFSIRYGDPYRSDAKPAPCRVIAPFPAPVGAIVRHRGTGAWLAVFQAKGDGGRFPQSGFYTTASRDLISWDKPRLLLAGPTLYDGACDSGGTLINYPSLLDPKAEGRNFDDVGDSADLYYTRLVVDGCKTTSDRDLLRRHVAIKVWP
ncbi:hypothetical protein [Enterovirga rhinocerotis]|uniref:BNR repeat protein n=1 Tax=Enterovirga rhinocerotis TaxID=1339210 RepID=A0A4R7C8Q6_9HYPH|nr:hypothetical protein [Enterovirga rhinocerotis]TDR93695.1 hypothetical protein EV668_0960 [Enterovirga rhinocerotis]